MRISSVEGEELLSCGPQLSSRSQAACLSPSTTELQHTEQYLACGHYSVGNTWGMDGWNEEGSPQETKNPNSDLSSFAEHEKQIKDFGNAYM